MADANGIPCLDAWERVGVELKCAMDWAEAVSSVVGDGPGAGERELWAWGYVDHVVRIEGAIRDLVACVGRCAS